MEHRRKADLSILARSHDKADLGVLARHAASEPAMRNSLGAGEDAGLARLRAKDRRRLHDPAQRLEALHIGNEESEAVESLENKRPTLAEDDMHSVQVTEEWAQATGYQRTAALLPPFRSSSATTSADEAAGTEKRKAARAMQEAVATAIKPTTRTDRKKPLSTEYGSSMSSNMSGNGDGRNRIRRENLPKTSVDILMSWFEKHLDHPYPSDKEKRMMIRRTGLSMNQV
jgi:hypothetical protein